jgi:hypothetical protein
MTMRLKTLFLSTILTLTTASAVFAQASTLVQQAPARLDAAAQVATSATSAATITLTPNGGETVYVYELDVQNCAGSAAVTAAAVTSITTTNLTGAPSWTLGSGTTAGACAQNFSLQWPTGLKAQAPGTAVTFVLPTFATNQTVRVNVAWRSAPIQ